MEGRDLIIAARRGAGLTQAELAERVGGTQSVISAWENGSRRPSFETVVAVARACGQDLGVGLPKADDSYNSLIRGQLRLGVSERIRSLDILAGVDIAATIADLAATGARLVLIGRVAAAAHGWPITLENPAALIEIVPAALIEFTSAAERCDLQQAGEREWRLGRDARLIAHERPPRTSGYSDLSRDAASLEIDGRQPVRVASLIDLIRMAEGDPLSTLRPFTAALWSTLEMVRLREREIAGPATAPITAVPA